MTDDDSREDESSIRFLRPFGYVESEPVVRRVDGRDLFVGNAAAADPTAHDRSFGFVLSVSSAAHPSTTHHCPLTDGPGNDWTAFEAAVDTARDLLRRDGSLLIHCEAGVSRSSTVLATALAAEDDVSFREALGRVQETRPAAVSHPALRELAVVYLAARSSEESLDAE